MSKRLRVVHRPGGYEAWRDQVPIRSANLRAILTIFGVVFTLGAVSTLLAVTALASAPTVEPTAVVESIPLEEATAEVVLPTETATPAPSSTPQPTSTPVLDLQMTLAALNARMEQLAAATPEQVIVTATAMPTSTQQPTVAATSTPAYLGWAVVTVDCSIIRVAPGRNYRALDSACRGARFPVLDIHNGWVQIEYQGADSAWIAGHLVRIEND